MKSIIQALSMFFLLLLLSACSNNRASSQAKQQAMAAMPEVNEQWSNIEQNMYGDPIGWINRIKDVQLHALVAEAQTNNPSIQAAQLNINKARKQLEIAGAKLLPVVNAGLGSTNEGLVSGSDDSQISANLQITWEPDLWGRISSRKNAAENSLQVVKADFRGASNLLAASVAQAYFLTIEASKQQDLAQSTVNSLAEIVRVVFVRSENGLASSEDLSLVKTDHSTAQDILAEISGVKRQALRSLELLLGRYPSATLELSKTLPPLPAMPPTGLPSDLLERRPDIVAAERQIAAAMNITEVAKAARLPGFQLVADLGGSSNSLSNILSSDNLAWRAVNSILAPIFNGGELKARVDLSEVDVKLAIQNYIDKALIAFEQVETALDQTKLLQKRFQHLNSATNEAQNTYQKALLRYEAGESDLIDLLTIQQRLFNAQSKRLYIERSQLNQYIALSLGLGGEW